MYLEGVGIRSIERFKLENIGILEIDGVRN